MGLVNSGGGVTVLPDASNAVILHLIGYGITNLAAFVAVIAFYNATGKEEVSDFAGLADRNPFIAMALTVSLLSLAGLPIFAGFITKFYLFVAAAIAMINSLISLYYYLIIIRQMYIQPAQEPSAIRVPWVTRALLGILVVATVLIGVYPAPLLDAIETATAVILPGV